MQKPKTHTNLDMTPRLHVATAIPFNACMCHHLNKSWVYTTFLNTILDDERCRPTYVVEHLRLCIFCKKTSNSICEALFACVMQRGLLILLERKTCMWGLVLLSEVYLDNAFKGFEIKRKEKDGTNRTSKEASTQDKARQEAKSASSSAHRQRWADPKEHAGHKVWHWYVYGFEAQAVRLVQVLSMW